MLSLYVLLCFSFVYFIFSFFRGVSINVLRHEAEFYGITPLGNFFGNMRTPHLLL